MPTRLAALSRSAATDAVVDRVDAAGGAGTITIYTGAQPANADDPPTGTLLVTITCAATAFGPAVNGAAPLAGVPRSGVAVATGTAGWARVADSAGGKVFDLTVSAAGAGGQIELASTSITTGQTVQLSSGTYTTPPS